MRSVRIFCGAASLSFTFLTGGIEAVARSADARSGETQVVAKVGGREITSSELRVEIARLGLPPGDIAAERAALESIVNRAVLSEAARDAELHRKPEAILRMRAAQEQALADLYLGVASQPAEPTRAEIDDFILANPGLFAKRRTYDFDVFTVATADFDAEKFTPLFDDSDSFAKLAAALEHDKVAYRESLLTQSGAAFPEAIRQQLGEYDVNDNIVLKGEIETRILKISAFRNDRGDHDAWAPAARRLLMEKNARDRATRVVERLKKKARVAYFRKSLAPEIAAQTAVKAPGE